MSDDAIAIKIDFGKVPMVMNKIRQKRLANRAGRAMMVHLRSKIAPYPPVSRRPQAGQWSDAERRAFFAKLKAGEIEVPYRRGLSPGSESLGKRWQIKSSGSNHSLSNNSSYASLVQGRKQIPYHKGTGWKTTETVLNDEQRQLATILGQEIGKELAA